MKKTTIRLYETNVDIISEQVSKNTFDGIKYEIINWVVFTDENGTYHAIPNGRLYYEDEEFSDEEITNYHNEFIKYLRRERRKYFIDYLAVSK